MSKVAASVMSPSCPWLAGLGLTGYGQHPGAGVWVTITLFYTHRGILREHITDLYLRFHICFSQGLKKISYYLHSCLMYSAGKHKGSVWALPSLQPRATVQVPAQRQKPHMQAASRVPSPGLHHQPNQTSDPEPGQ